MLIKAMILTGILFLVSCATTQQDLQKEGISVADVGNFSVKLPAGKHWQVNIDREKESVQFQEDRVTYRTITVSRDVLGKDKWHMSEEEIADLIAKSMTETVQDILKKDAERSGVARFLTGSFAVQFMNKNLEEMDGKKLYTFHLRLLGGGDAVFRTNGIERKHFIYFQPDFAKTHTIYRFSIFKRYIRTIIPPHDSSGLGEKDLLLMREIINSLQFK